MVINLVLLLRHCWTTVRKSFGSHAELFVKVWCTPRRAVYVVLIVCVAAFLITLPEFFEYVVVEQSSPADNRSNYSTADPPSVVVKPELTEFGASAGYQLGYTYVNQSLFTFLPLLLLFVFNSLLVKAVLSAARLRQAMTGTTMVSRGTTQLIAIVVNNKYVFLSSAIDTKQCSHIMQ